MLFTKYLEKSASEVEAYELSTGTFRMIDNGMIVPPSSDEDSRRDFKRLSNLVGSIGPKILNRKLDGIVGGFNIGGDDVRIRQYLDENYDLRVLIEKVARDTIVKGIGGLAVGVDSDGEPYVYRLGGYITKLYSDIDIDTEVGVLQIEQNEDLTYDLRVYEGGTVKHWTNKRNLSMTNLDNPDHIYESGVEQVAFTIEYQVDDANMPVGEMEQLAPLLKAIIAVESRIHRVSEIFGFPKPVIKGTIQQFENAPHNAIYVSEGGDVSYLVPASFDNLIKQKIDLLNELNEVATLPSGFVGRGNQPSGSAIREANIGFNNSIERYSRLLSRVFTNAFYVFFGAIGFNVTDFSITITPNRVVDEIVTLDKALELLDRGLLTPEYVAGLVQRLYDGIDEAMLGSILERFEQVNSLATVEDVLAEVE